MRLSRRSFPVVLWWKALKLFDVQRKRRKTKATDKRTRKNEQLKNKNNKRRLSTRSQTLSCLNTKHNQLPVVWRAPGFAFRPRHPIHPLLIKMLRGSGRLVRYPAMLPDAGPFFLLPPRFWLGAKVKGTVDRYCARQLGTLGTGPIPCPASSHVAPSPPPPTPLPRPRF